MPLTYDQALSAAAAFLAANPFPYPQYRYVPTAGRAIPGGWYFDFKFERLDGEPLRDERDAFGGAPGYKVLAAGGEVEVVGWEEFHRLNTAVRRAHLHIHWRGAGPAAFEVAAVRQVDPALRDKGLTEVAKILKDKPLWELGPFPTEGDADAIGARLSALGVRVEKVWQMGTAARSRG